MCLQRKNKINCFYIVKFSWQCREKQHIFHDFQAARSQYLLWFYEAKKFPDETKYPELITVRV